jgi:uncharacterized protein YqjF (DUF2071 family)
MTNPAFSIVEHRPWPVPSRPWIMRQTWHHLLFAHWPIDPDHLRGHIPGGVTLDLFDGRAWLAIVPFHMTGVTGRGIPALPWLSAFPELNVRTYVTAGGKPGVWFFSLDAARALAVHAARTLFNLPYFTASMHVLVMKDAVDYDSRRLRAGSGLAEFSAQYAPVGAPFQRQRGSLEYFLTERYCLYGVTRRRRLYRLDIQHPPWELAPAEAVFRRNTMAEAAGIPPPHGEPVLHFAARQDMVAWAPEKL